MPVLDYIHKALLAGLGVQESVKELVDELIKKGELNESQGAALVKEWTDKVERSGENLGKNFSELVSKTLEKMNIPTRDEIEELHNKVRALSARVNQHEESDHSKD
jgi:polyhydroxyalkanoate synthesis regulator phasin